MATYKEVMLSLRQGKYAQVYMLCGTEPYYIDKVSDWIEDNVLDAAAREFDQIVMYGKDLQPANSPDIAPVVAAARGFAMMGGKKVVILKEAQFVKKWEALGFYLDNPQPDTILVICYKYGVPDGRMGWVKKLNKSAVFMQSDKLRDYQVEKWISDYVTQQNQLLKQKGEQVSIDPLVAHLLAENLGNDLSAIVGALQKLIAGRPQGVKVIDAALVERNVGISKDFNVFELEKALIQGDVVKANRIVQYFATSKDHVLQKELPVLYGFFVNLLMYHYFPNKSDERSVAAALEVNSYFVKDYYAASRRYPPGKVFRIIGYIRDIDARSKGINNISADEEDLWKELIYKIMH